MKRVILGSLMLALSACATVSPEVRVRKALIEAGLPKPIAACMADRLVDRLSMVQLKKLSSLSKLRNRDLSAMTVNEFLHHVRALEDGEILRVVTGAGLGCAISA